MKKINLVKEIIQSPLYKITDKEVFTLMTITGKVSVKKEWRKAGFKKNGYWRMKYKDTPIMIHHVVFYKHYGYLDENKVINHKDGNGLNNHISNLELVTQAENNLHAYRVLKRKTVINNNKINKQIADKIRQEHACGFSYTQLQVKYNLSKSTISYIIRNKIWK